jgi:hypothetical protein
MFGCGSGGRMGLHAFEHGLHGKRSRMKCYIMKPTALEAFVDDNVHVHYYDTTRSRGIAIGTYHTKHVEREENEV